MPHIAITMIPGRDMETKQMLARKTQAFIASELRIDCKFVSVSIQDIQPENWEQNMEQFPEDILFVKPGV
ncbi:MAG: Tautomerase enzyme [Acutalibacter sp.]|nr:Tautomerase enzyme [Acutalibacter sp.]